MNEELEEILDDLKNYANEGGEHTLMEYEIKHIQCYITNLQEENERLKEENKRIFSKVNDDELLISNAMNYAEAQEYKSRCEKAIEYIKSFYETPEYIDAYDITYWTDKVMEILNGGDENE